MTDVVVKKHGRKISRVLVVDDKRPRTHVARRRRRRKQGGGSVVYWETHVYVDGLSSRSNDYPTIKAFLNAVRGSES